MLNEIIERAAKRQAQWKTIPVRTLPDPYMLDETTILGSYSYSKLSSRTRLIVKSECIGLGESGMIETPSAIARDYLREIYTRGPIVKSTQAAALMNGLYGVPNYAKPKRFEHGFYVDIKSAYWSIMGVAGWNVDYWPGQWLSAGRAPVDFPFSFHKIARNCLVSAGVPSSIMRYSPRGKFDEMRVGNPLANVSLMKLIQDVLNSIAAESLDAGATYVNTDGFIAPNENSARKIINIIEEWGLIASIKGEGEGEVTGSGAYKVGRLESVPHKLNRDPAPLNNVFAPHHKRWLKKSFIFWAREKTQDA